MGRGAAPLRRLLLSLLLLPTAGTGGRGAALTVGEPETAEELMEYRDPCKAGRGAGGLQLREKFASTVVADRCPCETLLASPVLRGGIGPGLTWPRRDPPPTSPPRPGRELPRHPAALPHPSGHPASPPLPAPGPAGAGGFWLPPSLRPRRPRYLRVAVPGRRLRLGFS